ncbi:hypothetical protein Tsubulata_024581, partial [Turnera subulata]
GCDASILLDDTPYRMSEKKVSRIINSSTHSRAYEMIDLIKEHLEVMCLQTVSCADTLVLAAYYTLRVFQVIPSLQSDFLDQDMVALSGAHTIGFAKCQTVLERLYTDADKDNSFALSLFN